MYLFTDQNYRPHVLFMTSLVKPDAVRAEWAASAEFLMTCIEY